MQRHRRPDHAARHQRRRKLLRLLEEGFGRHFLTSRSAAGRVWLLLIVPPLQFVNQTDPLPRPFSLAGDPVHGLREPPDTARVRPEHRPPELRPLGHQGSCAAEEATQHSHADAQHSAVGRMVNRGLGDRVVHPSFLSARDPE